MSAATFPTVRLCDVCEFKPSKSLAKRALSDDALVSFVPMNDLGELRMEFQPSVERPLAEVLKSYTYFADGDVICAKITPCFENGKMGVAAGLTNGVGFGSSEFVVMRPSPRLLPQYLFYFMLRDDFREAGAKVMTGAVGHKRVPNEFFERLEVPLPPLEEQKRIVAVLDEAFAALDRARTLAEANLADAEGLLGASIAGMFADVEESSCQRLADVSKFYGGSQPPKSEFISEPREGYIRLLQIRDFKSDEKAVYIRDDGKRRRCETSDILIGRYGASVGQIHRGKAGCYNVALIKTAPDLDLVDRDYFYYYLRSDMFQKPLLARSSRGAQDGFNKEDISDFPVPLPPLEQQRSVVREILEIEKRSAHLASVYRAVMADLSDLRQCLLGKAFAGELT